MAPCACAAAALLPPCRGGQVGSPGRMRTCAKPCLHVWIVTVVCPLGAACRAAGSGTAVQVSKIKKSAQHSLAAVEPNNDHHPERLAAEPPGSGTHRLVSRPLAAGRAAAGSAGSAPARHPSALAPHGSRCGRGGAPSFQVGAAVGLRWPLQGRLTEPPRGRWLAGLCNAQRSRPFPLH